MLIASWRENVRNLALSSANGHHHHLVARGTATRPPPVVIAGNRRCRRPGDVPTMRSTADDAALRPACGPTKEPVLYLAISTPRSPWACVRSVSTPGPIQSLPSGTRRERGYVSRRAQGRPAAVAVVAPRRQQPSGVQLGPEQHVRGSHNTDNARPAVGLWSTDITPPAGPAARAGRSSPLVRRGRALQLCQPGAT